MSREEIPIEDPSSAESIGQLFRLFDEAYGGSGEEPKQVSIHSIIVLFPFASTSEITLQRLVRRGDISVSQEQDRAWNAGRVVNAVFRDATLGLVTILFNSTIEAAISREADCLRFTLSGGIGLEIEKLPELFGYNERQTLTDIELCPTSVGYFMQETDTPDNKILVRVSTESRDEKTALEVESFLLTALADGSCSSSSDDACWWVVRTTDGCVVKSSERDPDTGACSQPRVNPRLGETEVASGPYDTAAEAHQNCG